jgi:hypothetical protein
MDPEQMRVKNQAAYRQLRDTITQTYPKGRFIAIWDGRVVADAATVREMRPLLQAQELDPREALVVEVGVVLPDYVTIL